MKKILFGVLLLIFLFLGYFSIGSAPQTEDISWGVNFSQKHAQRLGLDWKETYLAILDDLGAKKIKLIAYWDLIEKEKGIYDFSDLDWQIAEVEKRNVEILLVVGRKVPHWPECHQPEWTDNQNLLEYIEQVILRYRGSTSIRMWQVENEPFFPFGECPAGWPTKDFLKKEINLVKSLDDQNRPVVISDSGEFSFWLTAAKLGDVVATTLHRRVYSDPLNTYITHYWFRPIYYWRKAQIIDKFFSQSVICGELQAEPWCLKHLDECPLIEQKKTMNLEYFKDNIQFAKKTGLSEFYLWGAEWWYWLKEKQNQPEIWHEAKELFELSTSEVDFGSRQPELNGPKS